MHSLDDRSSFEFKGIRKKKNYGILPVALAYKRNPSHDRGTV
jgi:hypothetical protein